MGEGEAGTVREHRADEVYRMKRREFIGLLSAGVAAPFAARARQSDRVPRIGILLPNSALQIKYFFRLGALSPSAPTTAESPLGKILIGALADLGYAPGRNLAYEARGAIGDRPPWRARRASNSVARGLCDIALRSFR
jgi:hypothetical protein